MMADWSKAKVRGFSQGPGHHRTYLDTIANQLYNLCRQEEQTKCKANPFDKGETQAKLVASSGVTFVYKSLGTHLYFLKPICSACSLKHYLLIISSYFLINPMV